MTGAKLRWGGGSGFHRKHTMLSWRGIRGGFRLSWRGFRAFVGTASGFGGEALGGGEDFGFVGRAFWGRILGFGFRRDLVLAFVGFRVFGLS